MQHNPLSGVICFFWPEADTLRGEGAFVFPASAVCISGLFYSEGGRHDFLAGARTGNRQSNSRALKAYKALRPKARGGDEVRTSSDNCPIRAIVLSPNSGQLSDRTIVRTFPPPRNKLRTGPDWELRTSDNCPDLCISPKFPNLGQLP